MDPADIEYVLISHGHLDHVGGAKLLQERFGARVLMTAADWDMVERDNPRWKPRRDLEITDGQELDARRHDAHDVFHAGPHERHRVDLDSAARRRQPRHVGAAGAAPCSISVPTPSVSPRMPTPRRGLRDIAAAAGADVLLSNHTDYDGTKISCRRLRRASRGAPHPYVVGADRSVAPISRSRTSARKRRSRACHDQQQSHTDRARTTKERVHARRPASYRPQFSARLLAAKRGRAAAPDLGIAPVTVTDTPYTFDTAEQHGIRVSVVVRGSRIRSASRSCRTATRWSAERGARLAARAQCGERQGRERRRSRREPIAGTPEPNAQRTSGLHDVALHPQFAENRSSTSATTSWRRDPGLESAAPPSPPSRSQRGKLDGAASTKSRRFSPANGPPARAARGWRSAPTACCT